MGGVHVSQFLIEGGCSRQPVFSRRGLLIKGVFQVGQFPSIWAFHSHRQEPALFYKSHRFFIQFSVCSGHDRFVKFNRRGVLIRNGGEGKLF